VNDNDIVELYLSRNEDAINQTAIKYGAKLRNIAYRILEDFETSQECENSAYFETWRSIPPHEPRDYLFAFVGRIIRHLALDSYRANHRQKRQALYCELTQEMQECLPAQNNTEDEFEAEELSECINEFLSTKSEDQQNIFVRRYWYFDPVEDIAKAYGFTTSKVKTTLFRLREDLKRHLEEGGYDI